MDPITASALIVGGASLINGIGNMFTASNTNNLNYKMFKEANKFTAQENQKNRQWQEQMNNFNNVWNSHEAQLSRDWQEKMVAQENEFNSPVNQIRRMQEAGINPALLQMDGTIRSASPSGSPQASAGSAPSGASAGSVSPPHMQGVPFNLGNPILDALQARALAAQVESTIDENQRKNNLHPYDIQTAQGNLTLIGANVKRTEAETKEIEAQIPVLQNTAKKLSEEIISIGLSNEMSKKEISVWEDRYNREVKRWELENEILIENKKEIRQRIVNLLSQNELTKKEIDLLDEKLISAQNQNYLDGLEVKMRKDNEEAVLRYMWSAEKSQYEFSLQELKGKKRISDWRNSDKWYWAPLVKQLDFLNMLSESIGLSAGANASTSTSSSRSNVTSKSQNISDIFTHKE